ncbi:12023_t:CDS:2 [Ambispora gerdemannii]|uniref:12023_t:CDS:1 n=1 Tax=Ambispora gerdemannii TaxID=144530 RepID=A0A9N9CLT3_9GLOM|nr:12023_t:CDS:2 [Ambispora gerdemannii]
MNSYKFTFLLALFVYTLLIVALHENVVDALAIKRQSTTCGDLKVTYPTEGQKFKKGQKITIKLEAGKSGVTKLGAADLYKTNGLVSSPWSGTSNFDSSGKTSQEIPLTIPDGADVKLGSDSTATQFMIKVWTTVANGSRCTAFRLVSEIIGNSR